MECDRYPEHGQGVSQAWPCGVKRKLTSAVRLGAPGSRGASAALLAQRPAARRRPSPRPSPRAPLPRVAQDGPFMSTMDEITFWIVTKRAPCLAGFDHPRRPPARAGPRSASPVPESKKKKRRLIDNASEITERDRPNIFLKSTPAKCEIISSEKSDTLISDVDFNIKNSSVQAKNKKRKSQKNSRTTLHKKNKVVTSTPNVTMNLRRSLRKAQCNLNNNSHFKSSFEIFNVTTDSGNGINETKTKTEPESYAEQNRPSNPAGGDQNNKRASGAVPKPRNGALNGQFEDLSDVSGFTANYIKSTKINSKTTRKVRTKSNRNLAKESRHSTQKEEKSIIVSINKAINTGDPTATMLNCSTDSSQNIINVMSLDKVSKNNKVDKSTSLLKFVETKKESKDENPKRESGVEALNTSFQSTSTTGSRYPKRHKSSVEVAMVDHSEKTHLSRLRSEKRKTAIRNNSAGAENTDILSRTRSGQSIGLSKQPTNSVFVLSNTTEQVSSEVTVDMPNQVDNEPIDHTKKKRLSTKCARSKKSLTKSGQFPRDSFREKSGFSACFSDSDDEPLKPQKYLS